MLEHIYPEKLRNILIRELTYTSHKTKPEKLCAEMFIAFFIVSTFVAILYPLLFLKDARWYVITVLFLFTFVGAHALFYLVISQYGEKKAHLIERVLPDALQLFAVNLKSGYSINKSLELLTEEDFGVLNDELRIVVKEVALGKDLANSLIDMSSRIKSERFKRAVKLIAFSLKSGGKLADLCTSSAQELRDEDLAQEKMRSEVYVYVILIFVAIGICAPLLFALSSVVASMFGSIFGEVETGFSMELVGLRVGMPTSAGALVSYFLPFGLITLMIESVMGSLAIGLISKGKTSAGLKYIIPMIIISCIMFIITRNFLGKYFQGIVGASL